VKKPVVLLFVLVLLLLWPASAVLADGPRINTDTGQIFVEEDVTLQPGETFEGDLGIFDGDLTMPRGSVITGDVFVTNGDVEIAGRVEGDVAVISGDLHLADSGVVEGDAFVMSGDAQIAGRVGSDMSVMFGDMELESSAVVERDLMVMSGSLHRHEGSQVRGDEMPEIEFPNLPLFREMPRGTERPRIPERIEIPPVPEMPELPEVPEVPAVPPIPHRVDQPNFGDQVGRFVGRVFAISFMSMLFVGVGLLVVFVWPRHTHRVSSCIAAMPLQSFVLGLLTFVIAAFAEALAMVLMIIIILVAAAFISTVILIPIGLLLILLSVLVLLPVPIALAGGIILGWVALAELVGRKAIKLLNAGYVQPLGATLVGLIITVPIAALLWIVSPLCCGWPFIILFTSVGLGAVFHTRFGTQPCQKPVPAGAQEVLPPGAMDEEAGLPDEETGGTP
jgi:cytoskeletal protein CcmA (bactofilin family)